MTRQRSRTAEFSLAAMLFCTCVALSQLASAQAGGGTRIAGKVVNSTSGAPLSQARVTIANVLERDQTMSLITGPDGAFVFTGLAPSKYSLSAARRGFIESAYNQHEQYSTAIVTGGEADSEHLVFRLTPQALLMGRVLDEVGDPVRKASVTLYRQDQSTGVGLIRRIAAARTDDLGVYEFADLPVGNYFVSAYARPWYALHRQSVQKQDGSIETPAAHSFDVTYAATYYPNATDSDEATPIPLRGGEHLTADVHLSPVPALRVLIRGTDGPEHGMSMPQLLKKSFDSMENITSLIIGGRSDSMDNGRFGGFQMLGSNLFEFSGIPAGKYTMYVPDGAGGSEQGGSLAEIDLDSDGQELTPSSGEPVSSLQFSVQIPGEQQVPDGLVLALQNAEHKVIVASKVDPKGESDFSHIPPGKYNLLAATPSQRYSVTQITTNGNRSSGHGLTIVAGSTMESSVTLVGGKGSVQGFARRGGKGVAGAMIVLVPKDPEPNGDLFRRDQSDSDGSFSLLSVIPGEYTIVAIENGWDLSWSEPGMIAHYVEKGRKITVAPGTQNAVRLPESVDVQAR